MSQKSIPQRAYNVYSQKTSMLFFNSNSYQNVDYTPIKNKRFFNERITFQRGIGSPNLSLRNIDLDVTEVKRGGRYNIITITCNSQSFPLSLSDAQCNPICDAIIVTQKMNIYLVINT